MRDISLEELLEAGCHFGHQVNRRNPKADEFIFEARDNINIINLDKTREGLIDAAKFINDLSKRNGTLIIVGTKRQAKAIVKEEVERALKESQREESTNQGLFYVISRWVGGTLTNFDEVGKNYKKLKDLDLFLKSYKTSDYTKRELLEFAREKKHLENLYGGISTMEAAPDALLIIDTHLETTAIAEAKRLEIPIVGVVDTNADPMVIDYPIPANDDAVGSIKLIASYLMDAWIEGSKQPKTENIAVEKEKKKEEKTQEIEEKPKKVRKKKEVAEVTTS